MNLLEAALRDVAAALRTSGHDFALVGGLAVSARTEPRFTRDVDVAVAVADDPAAEALIFSLCDRGYRVAATVEQDATGRLATVRLILPGREVDEIVTDLLFASSGIEPELTEAATSVEVLPGLEVPVAPIGHLIALKVLAAAPNRPQDEGDLAALLRVATSSDIAQARTAVALIDERGFARGKDLIAEIDRRLAIHRP